MRALLFLNFVKYFPKDMEFNGILLARNFELKMRFEMIIFAYDGENNKIMMN